MDSFWPVLGAIVLVAFCFACRRLRAAAQPLRLELAAKGERLLGDPQLPQHLRGYVAFLLDSSFSAWMPLVFGFFYIPVIAVKIAFTPDRLAKAFRRFRINNGDTALLFLEVERLHDRITLANHPILWLIEQLVLLVCIPASLLINGIIRGCFPERADREIILGVSEAKSLKVLHHRRAVAA